MKLGSLFSGAGLGDLGWMMAGFDIRWQVEIDKYCRKILDLRFPEAKKYDDIKKIKGSEVEPVDIVVGGFPCQPFSVAGKQRGTEDDRNLWPEMLRVVKEVRPAWVVGENVSGIIPIYLDTVLADLEAAGYAARTFVFPAHALGANHRRERIWIVGHAGLLGQTEHEKQATGIKQSSQNVANTELCGRIHGQAQEQSAEGRVDVQREFESSSEDVSHAGCEYSRSKKEPERTPDYTSGFRRLWSVEPSVGRVAHGIADRVHRLKMLGNGQVVACTYFIGQQIMEFERLNAPPLHQMPQNL